MKRVLVLGAGGSAGINFIKSLRASQEDFYIVGTDTNKFHLQLPALDKRYLLPPATHERYIEKVNKIISIENIQFVHAQPDIEVFTLSKNRDKILANYMLPAHETIEICQNKYLTNKILEKNNVPVPKTYKLDEVDVVKAYIELKDENNRVWIRALKGAGSKASLPAYSPQHIKFWIEYWKIKENLTEKDFTICEYLPGEEYAFQSVWKDGTLITSQVRKRIEYLFGNVTPSGQTSTPSVALTVHDDKINEVAVKAIRAVEVEEYMLLA